MADFDSLGQFRERKAARTPAAKRPAQTGNKVPAGKDPDAWQLAQEFQSVAESWGVGLAAGLPVIHDRLTRRVDFSGLREVPGWVNIVRRMIKVFWDDEVDPDTEAYAVDQFCGPAWDNCRTAVAREDDATRWREIWAHAPRPELVVSSRQHPPRRQPDPEPPPGPVGEDRPSRTPEQIRERVKAAVAAMKGETK